VTFTRQGKSPGPGDPHSPPDGVRHSHALAPIVITSRSVTKAERVASRVAAEADGRCSTVSGGSLLSQQVYVGD